MRLDARPNQWRVLATVCLALGVIAINTGAINIAIPAIRDEFGASASQITWTLGSYLLALASLVIVGGQLGDVLGRRWTYLAGVSVFAAGSACVAAAPGIWIVIGGRVLQGVGAAFLMPGTIAIISEVFPPERRGTAIGIWGAVAGIGFAIGPLYGGFFTDVLDWRVIFWFDVVILGAALLLGARTLRGLGRVGDRRPDLAGAALLAAGLFLLVFAIERGPMWSWDSAAFVLATFGAATLLVIFVRFEARQPSPLVHLSLARIRVFDGGSLATFGNSIGLFGLLYFFNLYVQDADTFDFSALRASVVLLPYGAAMFAFSVLGGRVADRVGFRLPIVGALLASAVGLLLFSRFSVGTSEADLWLPMVLVGTGVGATFSAPSAAALSAVSAGTAGEAAGIVNMGRYLGAVFVVTVGSVLYGDPSGAGEVVDGFVAVSSMMAISLVVLAVVCGWLLAPAGRHRALESAG